MKRFITSLFVLLCVFSAIGLTFSFLCYSNLREKRIEKYLTDNDLSFLFQNTNGEYSNFLDDTKEALKIIGIPANTINSVVNSNATVSFIAKYLRQIFFYMVHQNQVPSISREDLILLAENNFPVIDLELQKEGEVLTDEQKNAILSLIDIHSEHLMDLFPAVNRFIEKIDSLDLKVYQNIALQDVQVFFQTFSNKTLIFSLILILSGSSFLIFLIQKKWKYFCKYISFALVLYISFFLVFQILLSTVFKEFLMTEWKSADVILNYFVNAISKDLWIFLLLSIGIFFLLRNFGKKLENNIKSDIIVESKDGREQVC